MIETVSVSPNRKRTKYVKVQSSSCLLFRPENFFRFLWEIIMLILALYLGVSVPFILAFQGYEFYPIFFDNFVTGLYILDIFVNLNTAVYIRGHLVIERKLIVKEYIKFWFWIDSSSALPIDLIIEKSTDSITYFKTFRLIKVVRIFKLVKLIKLSKLKYTFSKIEDFVSNRHVITFLSILKLQIYIYIVAHLIACSMFSVSSTYLEPESFVNLVINKCEDSNSNKEMYLTSIYWAYTTMVSIGYGDISPQCTGERILGIGCMLTSSVTFGVILGYISSMLSKNSEIENKRREIQWSAKHYLKSNSVPSSLQTKIKMYLDFKLEESTHFEVDLYDLLEILSEPLREQIFLHLNGAELINCKTFTLFPSIFSTKLSRYMHSQTFAPSDDILIESSLPVGIFFIQSGLVEIYDRKSKATIKTLGFSSYFGEIGLFTRKKVCASVRCCSYTEVLMLTVEDFDLVIEGFPECLKVFESIRDQCETSLEVLGIKCYLCGGAGHVARFCCFVEKIRQANKMVWLAQEVGSRKVGRKDLKRFRFRPRYSEFVWGFRKDRKMVLDRVLGDGLRIERALDRVRKTGINTKEIHTIFKKPNQQTTTYLSNILDEDDDDIDEIDLD